MARSLAERLVALRPTWVEVDLDAIASNVAALRAVVPPQAALMAVVKADGYGHGAEPVARAALGAGAAWLGVAIVEEGLRLRAALGDGPPILVLGYLPPARARDAVAAGLDVACYQLEVARACAAAGRALGRPARLHVKIDTGMGRIGVQPREAAAFIGAVAALPGAEVVGAFTHYADADGPEPTHTRRQCEAFAAVQAACARVGARVPLWHAGNSAVAIDWPDQAHGLVRLGIALYGLYPSPHTARAAARAERPVRLRPALAWKARLSHVKRVAAGTPISYGCTYRTPAAALVGTVPVGYGDGFARRWSNRGAVLCRGQRAPVIGRVCMDQFMVDLTGVEGPPPQVGEEVVLIGQQEGAALSAEEWAAALDTISYEVVCGIAWRVPRVYLRGGQAVDVRD